MHQNLTGIFKYLSPLSHPVLTTRNGSPSLVSDFDFRLAEELLRNVNGTRRNMWTFFFSRLCVAKKGIVVFASKLGIFKANQASPSI
jgi:hypothetical protein